MKICIYALHLGCGGVENYVTTVANILSSENEVEIISTYKTAPSPAFPLDERVKVTYLTDDFPHKEKLNARENICSVFCRYLHLATLFLKKYACNLISIKNSDADVIISTRIFHNRLIGRFAAKRIFKITGEHNHHNGNKAYVRKVVNSCKGFDLFIPISKELCDFYTPLLQKTGLKAMHIPFCIPPQIPSDSKREKHLIYAGRFSREKGVFDMIDVFEMVYAHNKETHLHLIGDGHEMGKLQKYVADKKLEERITFYGYRDKDFILGLMKKCSLYIMTSYTESFGIALLEAMSCGLHCVAFSDAQGAREIIRHGYNGYIIEGRDKARMARLICRTLESDEKMNELRINAQKTADFYSPAVTETGWKNVIALIDTSGKPPSSSALENGLKKAFTD